MHHITVRMSRVPARSREVERASQRRKLDANPEHTAWGDSRPDDTKAGHIWALILRPLEVFQDVINQQELSRK